MSSTSRVLARVATGIWLAAAAAASAQPGVPAITGTCAVRFFGTSTLHDFEGSAPCALLAIGAPDANGRHTARAEVAIARMDTGISARDKKMRGMFEAKKFPLVVATFPPIDPAALRAQRAGALPFRLALHGIERDVAPSISGYSESPGRSARFRATFDLSLRDFGLEAPVAMGFIQVGDGVKVVVDVELVANGGGAPTAAGSR